MPRLKDIHAWMDGDEKGGFTFHASIRPRGEHHAVNDYDHPHAVLVDASARGMNVIWEKPDEIDKWLLSPRA